MSDPPQAFFPLDSGSNQPGLSPAVVCLRISHSVGDSASRVILSPCFQDMPNSHESACLPKWVFWTVLPRPCRRCQSIAKLVQVIVFARLVAGIELYFKTRRMGLSQPARPLRSLVVFVRVGRSSPSRCLTRAESRSIVGPVRRLPPRVTPFRVWVLAHKSCNTREARPGRKVRVCSIPFQPPKRNHRAATRNGVTREEAGDAVFCFGT